MAIFYSIIPLYHCSFLKRFLLKTNQTEMCCKILLRNELDVRELWRIIKLRSQELREKSSLNIEYSLANVVKILDKIR